VNLGAFAYVEKGGDPNELLNHVHRAMESHLHRRAQDLEDAVAERTRELQREMADRKQAEAQYRQAQKMEAVGQLAGGVAHDFRNQLTVIQGFVTMLRRHDMVTPDGQALIDHILEAVGRSTNLTSQLLAFSRKEMLQPEITNLADLVSDLSKSLPTLIGEDIHLSIAGSLDACTANIDPGLFHQAIMNLALNARDAMSTGGTLIIETDVVELDAESAKLHSETEPGRYASIVVEDSGIGMDEKTRQRVFEPFFTTKEVGQGTGLGLSMVYGFVKQSGGSIECESKPGRGTKFTILFPWTDAPVSNAEQASRDAAALSGSEHILVVEDEASVRQMVVASLEDVGYQVIETAAPAEALSIAGQHEIPIDLLVTDVVMPDMNGVDLAERIQAARPDLRTLFISGYSQQDIKRRGAASVFKDLLTKPFTHEQLLERVRAALDSTGQSRCKTP
jgi:signal transduction histidine kinase/ActR/RegA family two-component response regulator